MEKEKIVNILKSLDSSNSKQSSYNRLSTLRKAVTTKDQFIIVFDHDGIRILIGYLLEKNANVIDIGLSILGNCCTEKSCAKEVIKHNGLRILTNILKNSSLDTIICRTCRLIGNIAKFDNYSSEIYKYGVVSTIINILNESTSEENGNKISIGTKMMAIRVLRSLWENGSNRSNIISDGAVKAVSLQLIYYNGKWCSKPTSKKQTQKILEDILKCLLLFSKWGTLECAQQVLADGNGFKTLVSLINLNPSLAVKCLTNLSHVATSRSAMANAEAVNSVVSKIKQHVDTNANERCPYDIVYAFCLLCKHPMNCTEIKRADGLQLILKLLRYCKNTKQEYQIVNALSCFHYDEQSQEILVSNGIINIIIDCIERNLKVKSDLKEKHLFVKEHAQKEINVIKKHKRKISNLTNNTSLPKRRCVPGGSRTSVTPGISDCVSTSSSTSSSECNLDDDYNSANCSLSFQEKEKSSSDSMIDSDSNDGSTSDKHHFESSDLKERTIMMMLGILSRVSHLKPLSIDTSLGSKKSLIILLKYLRESRFPQGQITSLLIKIVKNPDYFLYLIETETIQQIHSLMDPQPQHDWECTICSRLANISESILNNVAVHAETENGKAVLYNFMRNGNIQDKIKCFINITLILKSKPMLLKLMDTWDGLNILLNQFTENTNSRFVIIMALNNLACCANVNKPVISQNSALVSNLGDKYNSHSKNLTITLDDGSTVETDKTFLIEKSNYFKVMLTGAFKESNQTDIRLTNVSKSSLQCLLNLLQGDYDKMPPHKLVVSISTILDVIALTDVYLLDSLTDWLTRCVEQYSLSVNTACEIYNWSVKSGTNYLRVETVAFILTENMKQKERFDIFESIIEYGLIHDVMDDVHNLISRYLKIK